MLLSRNIIIKRFSKKLDAKFLEPFKVVEMKGKYINWIYLRYTLGFIMSFTYYCLSFISSD